MTYIKRDLEPKILSLSKEYSAILITGPRQVGKTTILRQLMQKNRAYVTLDDLENRAMAQNDPALFLQLHDRPILIDEVQYAPQLFSYIKIEIDNGAESGSFWLTGSQSFRMMELAQESLAGRVALLHMPSLSQHEIYGSGSNSPFSIDLNALKERATTHAPADMQEIYQRIWKGSMPGLISGRWCFCMEDRALPTIILRCWTAWQKRTDVSLSCMTRSDAGKLMWKTVRICGQPKHGSRS